MPAIIPTKGFGDTLEIGRPRRQTSDLNEVEYTDASLRTRVPPLVPRDLVVEIEERLDATGKVVVPLNEKQARAALKKLKPRGIDAIAVCTLWSTQNPVHEKRLRALVKAELPDAFVSVSHEISPAVGEYARMSTTAANAALGPLPRRYLSALETRPRQAGVRVPVLLMACAGRALPTPGLSEL